MAFIFTYIICQYSERNNISHQQAVPLDLASKQHSGLRCRSSFSRTSSMVDETTDHRLGPFSPPASALLLTNVMLAARCISVESTTMAPPVIQQKARRNQRVTWGPCCFFNQVQCTNIFKKTSDVPRALGGGRRNVTWWHLGKSQAENLREMFYTHAKVV